MRIVFLYGVYLLLSCLSVRNPVWGIFYYTGISIIRPEMLTWGGTAIKHLFPIAQGAIILSSFFTGTFNVNKILTKEFICFGLFIAGLYVSTWFSPYYNPMSSRYNFQLVLIFILCAFMKMNLFDAKKIRNYYFVIICCLSFIGLWGVLQSIQGNPDLRGLFGSFVPDRCAICGVFVLYLPLAFYKIIASRNVLDIGIGVFIGLLFALDVVLTYSRAGFLGLTCAVLWFIAGYKHRLRLGMILLIILIIVLPLLPEQYTSRVSQMFEQDLSNTQESVDKSASSRIVLWENALLVFNQNPVFGVGALNCAQAMFKNADYFVEKISEDLWIMLFGNPNRMLFAHNTFVNILAEGGLMGSIPLYLFIYFSFTKNRRIVKYVGSDKEISELITLYKCIKAGLIGYCVIIAFANMRYVDYFYWQLIMLTVVSDLVEKMIYEEENVQS